MIQRDAGDGTYLSYDDPVPPPVPAQVPVHSCEAPVEATTCGDAAEWAVRTKSMTGPQFFCQWHMGTGVAVLAEWESEQSADRDVTVTWLLP